MSSISEHPDYTAYYKLQQKLRKQVITSNELGEVKYIAGADVAYDESAQRMAGALVVLDTNTLELVEESVHLMDITFPYVPGLFSFREIPALVEAYHQLKVKPNLIVADGHGIAHPKGVGMASHLGLELDLPTIGCAKSRLIGQYEEPPLERGAFVPLVYEERIVGNVLRTQTGIKPLYISIGHKISLEEARRWVLKLSPNYRQPETTRYADALVRNAIKQ